MSAPPPIGAGNPVFLAVFHLPGVDLTVPVMDVGGIWLQRISWADWVMVENTDDAERLYQEFLDADHAFCCVNLDEKELGDSDPQELQGVCESALMILVDALRLHKAGPVIDPRLSTRYLRLRDLNIRQPGPYSARLLEPSRRERYRIEASDLAGIAFLHGCIRSVEDEGDPGVMLALRSFRFAYGFGLTGSQKLAFLFSALEALFGEYRMANRPTPRVTLGAAAAIVSRETDPASVGTFLDGTARSIRNQLAHGDPSVDPDGGDALVVRVEAVVRDGLRALVVFTSKRSQINADLDVIEAGLGGLAPKEAFQKLLAHAAKGSALALSLLRGLTSVLP